MTSRYTRLYRGLGWGYAALFYGFLYLPIVVLVTYSFNDSRYSLNWQGFSWRWYQSLWQDDQLLQIAMHSLTLGLVAATLATLLGTLIAITLYRYHFVGRQITQSLVSVLIVSPDIVMGISLLILFISLQWPLGFWTLLVAHVTLCFPFVVVTVASRLKGFDSHLLEAASDLGASEYFALRKILMPMLMPAIVAGWLLSFTLSLDDLVISFFVTGPEFQILPLKIYAMIRHGVSPEINALCSVMLVLTLLVAVIAHFLQRKRF